MELFRAAKPIGFDGMSPAGRLKKTARENIFVLVVADQCTGMIECTLLWKSTATTVTAVLPDY